MAEEYAAKMSRKTDAELRDYVDNRYQYREEAVLAALDELARRGMPEPGVSTITEELRVSQQETNRREAAAREAEAEREKSRRAARGEMLPEAAKEAGPALYSPGTIALFSVLPMSMMIGGGILLGLNLFRLRRIKALLLLLAFMVVYLLVFSNIVAWVVMQAGLPPLLGFFLFNVPAMLVYIRWFWPRYITPGHYRSRSIFLPMVLSFLIAWALQYYAVPYLLKHQSEFIKQQPPEMQQQMKQQINQLEDAMKN
ncbi:hypothetical protein SAMN06265337_3802 [Hymenobacter gelipurpurascens]|uniref:Uncharacterized protein n=1 Tax=Hymenobacter gelipurpurascens TaxID=89968 RepID=A0A212UGC6_9BACT|nr:hypothetical protein [Hymenobacter gelipurpurascens]SNC77220.1 hypothetical protein SAMN06265337_3802 [Hymenobacter gelipurpurascens]